MSEDHKSEFVVCAESDPLIVKIKGKANYLNCSPVNDFFELVMDSGAKNFLVDFQNCQGMDSTFLGVLAGVATKAMKMSPVGKITLANLNSQNQKLINGLGLHHLPTVEFVEDVSIEISNQGSSKMINEGCSSLEASPEVILEAHERLMKLNRENERRFQDVVRFLRKEAGKEDDAS